MRKFSDPAPMERVKAPPGWVPPSFIDNRGYCLPADDQGRSSACAGFAMAGLLEVYGWKTSHVPESVNAFAIYDKAKELDGDGIDGTTLEQVFNAAKALTLLPASAVAKEIRNFDEYMFALHSHSVCLLGFQITDGWNSANSKTGWIGSDPGLRGGHAVLGCWGQLGKGCGFQNSWSKDSWGVQGFGRLTVDQFNQQLMGGLEIIV